MFKKGKQKRTLDKIGKNEYNFDFKLEKDIYCNLCCMHMNKNIIKKIQKENLEFNTYRAWRQYICKKYKNYKSEQLLEFSKYLNQIIRNTEPGGKYWELIIPVLMTLVFTHLFKLLLETDLNFTGIPALGVFFCIIIIEIVVIIPLVIVIWNTMRPIWDNITERNFLIDYKEIIDSMIKEEEIYRQK